MRGRKGNAPGQPPGACRCFPILPGAAGTPPAHCRSASCRGGAVHCGCPCGHPWPCPCRCRRRGSTGMVPGRTAGSAAWRRRSPTGTAPTSGARPRIPRPAPPAGKTEGESPENREAGFSLHPSGKCPIIMFAEETALRFLRAAAAQCREETIFSILPAFRRIRAKE